MYKTIFFILISFSLSAQKTGEGNNSVFYIDTVLAKHYSFTKTSFPENERTISSFLEDKIDNLKGANSSLQLLYTKESPGGKHYCFTQYIFNIPVYHSMVKVNILNNKKTVDVVALTFSEESITSSFNNADYLFPEEQKLTPVSKSIDEHFEILKDKNGEILYYFDRFSYSGKKDTTATVSVFNPDPLTTAETSYETPYVDNDDFTNSALDAQRKWKTVNLKFQNDTFLLENDYYIIKDFDAPATPVVTSVMNIFDYDRSQSGFEDINAFYHLSSERNYIIGLQGFNSLVNVPLHADPHAFSGAENSSFDEFSTPASLRFGEGGIDDAEDADVIVHEYAHFISANAAPHSNIGKPRKAIDEGFGDYLAASYSQNISTFNWSKVFNWDGNNGTWQGRSAASTKHYPENYIGNEWKDGEMWSSTLMQIKDILGRSLTDSLIFQALYAQSTNTSMIDAAINMVDADTALFNGKYHNIIYKKLQDRGFFPPDDTTSKNLPSEILLINSQEFAKGNNLNIQLPFLGSGTIKLYDVNGKLVDDVTFTNQQNFNYFNANLSSGLYFIEISAATKSKKTKLIRY